jgi:hypothetical protein
MGIEVNLTVTDVNGQEGKTAFWTDTAGHAQTALELFGPITTGHVTNASYTAPLDITGAWNHAATATNIESALSKMKIQFNGAAAGGFKLLSGALLSVPAPLGTIINGASGSPTDALLTPLIPFIFSAHGDAMTVIKFVRYARGR